MSQTRQQQLWGIVLAASEETPVRDFLTQLCGGRGIKQFCAVTGRRSMVEHTLARVERLIPRERILVVVSRRHQDEVAQYLAHWPADNVIVQPANRGALSETLLALTHLWHRDPAATAAVFPADHFVQDSARFMSAVERAVVEVQGSPEEVVLLGVIPDQAEESYGWIELAAGEKGRESRAIRRLCEQPSQEYAYRLRARGAVWNTSIYIAHTPTLWRVVHQAVPDLCNTFNLIRLMLCSAHAALFIEHMYETMPTRGFSVGVCEPLASQLRVLPVANVGWSDWGSVERILMSLQDIGKLEECLARLRHCGGDTVRMLRLAEPQRSNPNRRWN